MYSRKLAMDSENLACLLASIWYWLVLPIGLREIQYQFHGLSGLAWMNSGVMLGLDEMKDQFHGLSGLAVMISGVMLELNDS